jgi:hypothetical protein
MKERREGEKESEIRVENLENPQDNECMKERGRQRYVKNGRERRERERERGETEILLKWEREREGERGERERRERREREIMKHVELDISSEKKFNYFSS